MCFYRVYCVTCVVHNKYKKRNCALNKFLVRLHVLKACWFRGMQDIIKRMKGFKGVGKKI